MPLRAMGVKVGLRLAFAAWLFPAVLPTLTAQTANFAARQDYFAGGFPLIVGVGDFNNDGIPDIVTNTACVFFGNGDGTFRPGPCIPGTPFGVAIADFDGDGNLDLAEVDGVGYDVFIYYGNGDGTFAPAVSLPLNLEGSAVAAADLNGDGRPDLVVGTGGVGLSSAAGVSVILNLGNRDFASPTVYLSPELIYAVAVGDVNQDGVPDIAVSLPAGITFLLGAGDGTFTQGNTLTLAQPAGTVVLADLDKAGMNDIITGGGPLYTPSIVSVFLATGGGAFAKPINISYPNGALSVAVGDVNGDGYADLVVADASSLDIDIVLNNGKGGFKAGPSYDAAGLVDVVLAPLRKPNLLDIVGVGFSSGMVSVLLNQGKGTYQDGLHIPFSTTTGQPATADFNGDGHPDLAITTGNGVSILLGTGQPRQPFHDRHQHLAGGGVRNYHRRF